MPSTSDPTTPVGVSPPGYRLPEATRLGPVRLQISHLSRSLSFYGDVLGLRVLERAKDGAVLGVRDEREGLVELVERPGARALPPRRRLGLFHVAFLLPSRQALGRFALHLQEMGLRPGMSDHLVSEAIYLSDPDGLGIEVYADRPRSSRQRSGRQLVMTTEPLDVQDLVEAAGDEAWNGAPAGTTIGHIHLHVGDLEEASAFYHEALGLDRMVWNYSGALFLAAGGYHHHLGLNTWASGSPPAAKDEARLMEWRIVVPDRAEADAAAESLRGAGYGVSEDSQGWRAADPWGTMLRIDAED